MKTRNEYMPPKKIDFKVVHVSGEDEKFPSSDLNSDKHGPLVHGWISQRFCLYPIDLIIQFNKKIVLKKVQILSHQYLIASKIEFYIGDSPDVESTFENAKYTRLGYVELSSNERTDLKARELKSVHVDAEGSFLKLVMHKNFLNRLNVYNQVGVIAINVIGVDLDDEINYSILKNNEADPTVLAAMKRTDYISPLDDLAFAMYQDAEISQIIRNLDKKKTDCVLTEKYDEAKRLKQAISELYKIGERLARYDIEKRQAIEEEDYEKAKLKKQQIQQYRSETYRQLQLNNLLEFIEPESRELLQKKATLNEPESRLEIRKPDRKTIEIPKDLDLDNGSKSPAQNSPKSITSNRRRFSQTSPRSQRASISERPSDKPSTPYEDRVIPTLRNSNKSRIEKIDTQQLTTEDETPITQTNDALVPDQDVFEQDVYDPMDGTEEMTEREVREAALMNDYLGKQIVTKLYSKNFQNREDAIQEVFNNLSNYKGEREEAKALMRASGILVAKMCKESVFSVFNNTIKLFQFLVTDFAKSHSLGKNDINYVLEKSLPILIHRTGDTNARLRQRAQEYLVEMASFHEIKPLNTVPNYCTVPIKLHIAPRLALSRVEMIDELIKRLGTKDNGLNVDNISKFCAQALDHTSGETRELAAKILVQMYREYGNVVRKYLPPDNEMNRRNKKYRSLYDAFDSIDGKPLQHYDKNDYSGTQTPRPARNRTPTKNRSKTPTNRNTSLDRKTPLSMADESEYNPDNTCMFCGEINEKFIKQGFEMHYWKSCPMLRQCNDCKQVIEVAGQNEHLLTECQYRNNYKKCPRCTESVNVTQSQENDFHFKFKKCIPFDKNGNRCPLCHTNIGLGEEIWKEHLMSFNGCNKNDRRNLPPINNNHHPVPNDTSKKQNIKK